MAKTITRIRTESTKDAELLEDTQEWLSRGGWSLIYARTTYAAVRTSAVLGWSRLSSKRMTEELKQIRDGKFDFDRYLHLIEDNHNVED